jgi:hypothetical protein
MLDHSGLRYPQDVSNDLDQLAGGCHFDAPPICVARKWKADKPFAFYGNGSRPYIGCHRSDTTVASQPFRGCGSGGLDKLHPK